VLSDTSGPGRYAYERGRTCAHLRIRDIHGVPLGFCTHQHGCPDLPVWPPSYYQDGKLVLPPRLAAWEAAHPRQGDPWALSRALDALLVENASAKGRRRRAAARGTSG
jgi:hypothetical protein